jgi:uncharacterized iron-regulated membrane protein
MIRRIIGQIHLWTGVVLFVPLVVLGLTGSLLVFEDELNSAFGPSHRAAGGAVRPTSEIIAAARSVAPAGFVPVGYTAPIALDGVAVVRLSPGRRDTPGADMVRIRIDPVSLETIPEKPTDILRQIFFLHSTLLMKNREGRQLVGWLGLAMLVMGVSGLTNWWPRRGQWRGAFSISKQAYGFRLHRELHGAAGIWGLVVFVAVSLAGVCLAFPETARSVIDLVLPARDLRGRAAGLKVEPIAGVQPADIDEAIALARGTAPGAEPGFAFLPARADQPFLIGLLRADQQMKAPAVTIVVDPWSRRVIEVLDPREYSIGERILAWQHALHAGQALGWVWKLLVFLCGLLPLLFAVSGVTMWRLRRGRAGSPLAAPAVILDHINSARRAGE